MKKAIITTAILFLCSLCMKGQFSVGVGMGGNFTQKHLAGTLQLQQNVKGILIQGGYHITLDNISPVSIELLGGYDIAFNKEENINILGGYSYLLLSSDYKGANKSVIVFSLQYEKYITQKGKLFAEITKAGKYLYGTFGLKFVFI
jgi:hypothetical protein